MPTPTNRMARPAGSLVVHMPDSYRAERAYIAGVLFGEFLGIDHEVVWWNRRETSITHGSRGEIVLHDGLFATPAGEWLTESSMPASPLAVCEVPRDYREFHPPLARLPVLYGTATSEKQFVERQGDTIRCGLDLLGSAFFMLSRYEEVANAKRDRLGRFTARDSIALREGFLDRPIVNDYTELLWAMIKRLWPNMRRQPRHFDVVPTHDVDRPFVANPPQAFARNLASDLITRRNLHRFARHAWQGGLAALGLPHRDSYDTFDWLMDVAESNSRRCAFYFLTSDIYSLDDPPIRKLIHEIHDRGHEIGLHPNFGTSSDGDRLREEYGTLVEFLRREGLPSDAIGGRQHYLCWEAPTTWQLWDDVGLAYDSTLSFADHVGFRCGTCHRFPVFNVIERKPLRLIERPLLIMEGTLFDPSYQRLDHRMAARQVERIFERTRQCAGEFRILWHNSWFDDSSEEFDFYRSVVSGRAA